MAEIMPFRGYRFNLKNPRDLGLHTAPPYDMLTPGMIDDLYGRGESNIVRVIQNRPEEGDTSNRDRHRRASRVLDGWIAEGVMALDDSPSVYLYEQIFTDNTSGVEREAVRTGVVVLVKLVDFRERIVLPHEATLSGPKKDRYELLEESRTHTEQIFGLLDDNGEFHRLLRGLCSGNPDGEYSDSTGVTHRLYRCVDNDAIERMMRLARPRTILIADGHHRYETALNFYNDHPLPENAFTMMTLVSTADPGLLIRPFHRLIRRTENQVAMRKALERWFSLEDYGKANAAEIYRFIGSIDPRSFLFLDCADGKLYGCALRDEGRRFLETALPEKSMLWKLLPVSMVNVMSINSILGLPLDGHVLHDMVEYVNDAALGIETCLERDGFLCGFFIRPTSIATVGEIVAAGERMPQKSTNFFPKIHSGIVLYRPDRA